MKIEMLDVGWFSAPAGIFRAGDDMESERSAIPCRPDLIETATERVLIDTGLNPAAIADPASYYERPDIFAVTALEQEQSVAEQLDVDRLTKVVLTHLHWDHVGGLHLIPASVPIVLQRSEWQAATTMQPCSATSSCRATITTISVRWFWSTATGPARRRKRRTPPDPRSHARAPIGPDRRGRARWRRQPLGIGSGRPPVPGLCRRSRERDTRRTPCGMRDAGLTVFPGHDPAILRPGNVTARPSPRL